MQILQAFHILRSQLDGKEAGDTAFVEKCKYINCVRQASRNGLLLIASQLESPNPDCFVCRSATVHVSLNLTNWTLQHLLDKILKADLGFVEPAIMIEGNVVWEEGEDDFVVNLPKKLSDLPCGGIQHGTVLLVEDYSQDLSVEVVVSHCEEWPKEKNDDGVDDDDAAADPFKFKVGGSKPVAVAPPSAASAAAATNGEKESDNNADDDEDDIIEICEEPDAHKKRPANGDHSPPTKKRKANSDVPADCEVIEID